MNHVITPQPHTPPLISIITINLNNLDGLRKTIQSVLEQTYKNIDWIIIDGGSTDGSRELIEQNADRFAYWVSEPDEGIYNAMNKGIRMANGKYVQFLNSGDSLWDKNILERVFAKDYEADILFGDCNLVENGEVKEMLHYPDVMSLREILDINFVHNGMFFKRELFEQELYDESVKISADFKFNVKKVLENKTFEHIPLITIAYDATGISASQFDLLLEEQKEIASSLISPSIMKDIDKLRDLLKDDCLERIQAHRNRNRMFHKMVTFNLMVMDFLTRIGIR